MSEVYVAAGSNIAPEHNLELAVAALAREFPGSRFSPWYRNRAAGFEGDDFINLVAGFATGLPRPRCSSACMRSKRNAGGSGIHRAGRRVRWTWTYSCTGSWCASGRR